MSNPSEKPASPEQLSTERSDTGISDPERTKTYKPEDSSATPILGRPPRLLGEYELLERLGSGGMGEVYKARHRRLGKLVALKLLASGTQHNPERLARFVREMRAIGELDHPNIVEAHDAGEQDGIVYLVMKLVSGTDLAARVRQHGPLPIAEACELTRQAAIGLQYLHDHGLVHRDIKPSNLMRTPEGVVKILDLGLARWLEAPAVGEELTESGQPMGTPDYLAPEQATSAAEVDVRADLYGLGATLFCLLTGHAPFAHRSSVYEKLWAHKMEPPPDVRSLRPEVPPALAELLSRLLAKERKHRPESPAEVAAALAPFAAGLEETVSARSADVPARPRRSGSGKARLIAIAAAASGLMLLMALPLELNRRDPPREPVVEKVEGRPRAKQVVPPLPPVQKLEGAKDEGRPREGQAPLPLPPVQQPEDARDEGRPRGEQVRVSLEVRHFAIIESNGIRSENDDGLLGRGSFETYCQDRVAITASLSRPAYAYLLAFRPDGSEKLCFPRGENERPPLTDQPAAAGVKYTLNQGEGLHVFAVVVSSQPLPAYREWRAQRKESPWKNSAATPGVVWCVEGTKVETLTEPGLMAIHAKGRHDQGKAALTALTEWLRQSKDVDTIAAVAFAVQPKKGLE